MASHCSCEPALHTLTSSLSLVENHFCCCPCRGGSAGGGCWHRALRPALPRLFLGWFSGKIKNLQSFWLCWCIPGCLSIGLWMIYASPGQSWWHWCWQDEGRLLFITSVPSPRQCLCFPYRIHSLAREDISTLIFLLFSRVTFLLPKKLHVPSGQVIKLEDQQYMKKELDQFTEKWLKAVYYIFCLFFFFWEIICQIIKGKNQVNGMTSN